MTKIYKVYDSISTLGYTKTKAEAMKLKRFYSYTSNFTVHIAERWLEEPNKCKKFDIPNELYVRASSFYSPDKLQYDTDIHIETCSPFKPCILREKIKNGLKTGVMLNDKNVYEAYFKINTVEKERRIVLVGRCRKKAFKMFKEFKKTDE